jgi:hydroxyethylthiazole kinase
MMPLVTGLGCTATALTGAFLCVARDSLTAATEAMAVMSTAGSMAAEKAGGPGTLQLYFYDALYNLTLDDLRRHVIVEEV